MNLSRTTQPTVGAGAGVYFGSGLVDRGEGGSVGAVSGGGACARWTRRCSTMRAPPKDTITQLAGSAAAATIQSTKRVRCARFGKQTATGSESSAYTSRTALLTKRRAVRSIKHLVTKRA